MNDDALVDFIARHPRLFVLTGAGCSTESGIPDYRDEDGAWKRRQPITFAAFTTEDATRRRYWARSMLGWRAMSAAHPGRAHVALARLETLGRVRLLVTQNVDGLHEAAGSRTVVDLHGRLDTVRCLDCQAAVSRAWMQERLLALNPAWDELDAGVAPDGDADLERPDFSDFRVPACPRCGGMLKPDVVFFGESVPRDRVERAFHALDDADGMLVVGSSLMVYSGFRFVRHAAQTGKAVAAVNLGRTRADDLLTLKIRQPCGAALETALASLSATV